MVGRRNPDALLQCNTYLRTFDVAGKRDTHWCIDPGSQLDYAEVRRHLIMHLGSLAELSYFSLNHQDPDVVANLVPLTEENASLTGFVSEDAWRLVRHLGARPKELRFAHRFRGEKIDFAGGHRVLTVPTPFCHFRGAMAFYDLESRVLFSGDLFGGLNDPGRLQLWAEEEDWPGIAIFHQIYMPSREAVAYAVNQIRALDPPVEVIAPQHGFVLRGQFMHDVMERLERLPVGMDRLPRELDDEFLDRYQVVFQQAIEIATAHFGRPEVLRRLSFRDEKPPETATCIRVTPTDATLLTEGIQVLPWLVDVLSEGESPAFRNTLKLSVLEACLQQNVPLPQIAPGMETEETDRWIG